MNSKRIKLLSIIALMAFSTISAQQKATRNLLRETNKEFFTTDEARRVGDQVLAYQRVTGGWPKNIDMGRQMTADELAQVAKDKQRRDDSTIDNNATTMQMKFLARLFKATGDTRYRDAFVKAVEFLLSGQYDNGGWPQFWPQNHGYQVHITFNDDAMVRTMEMLRDVAAQKSPYDGNLTDEALRARMTKAFDKGVECILATQIIVDGQPTVWCQQHDEKTFKPAKARAYELPSYCSQESAAIVDLLMQLPNPDTRVKRAVNSAMKWFDTYKLTGLKLVRTGEGSERNTQLVKDAQAEPLWARYYDLDHCVPYVCDRDGVPRRHLEEIGSERRNGYSWFNSRPAELYKMYDEWAAKYDPADKVNVSLSTKGANERDSNYYQ